MIDTSKTMCGPNRSRQKDQGFRIRLRKTDVSVVKRQLKVCSFEKRRACRTVLTNVRFGQSRYANLSPPPGGIQAARSFLSPSSNVFFEVGLLYSDSVISAKRIKVRNLSWFRDAAQCQLLV